MAPKNAKDEKAKTDIPVENPDVTNSDAEAVSEVLDGGPKDTPPEVPESTIPEANGEDLFEIRTPNEAFTGRRYAGGSATVFEKGVGRCTFNQAVVFVRNFGYRCDHPSVIARVAELNKK